MRRGAWLSLLLLPGLLGCGGSDAPPPHPADPPPAPPLDGAEPAVAERVSEARRAAAARPGDDAAWAEYGRVLQAHGLLDAAWDAYQRGARLDGAHRFACLYLAGCTAGPRRPDQAIDAFRRALEVRDDYRPAHLRLAELLEQAGRAQEARRHYRRALELGPISHARLGLGRLLLAGGRVREAIEELEAAAALRPDHAEVHAALARAWHRLGDDERAAHAARAAGTLRRTTGFSDPLMFEMLQEGVAYKNLEQLALAYLAAGDTNRALTWIDHAIAARPESLQARFHRGNVLAAARRFDEALREFGRVLAKRPDHVETLRRTVFLLGALGRVGEAVPHLERLLRLDPSDERSRRLLESLRPGGSRR